MGRLRKNPVPVRLQVSYEYAPERELRPAIVVLAAMLRGVEADAPQRNWTGGSIVYRMDTPNERV